MALVVPNPTVPTNGQALDATPLLANLNAVYQAIQTFDGSQIQAGTIAAAAFAASINPNTLVNEQEFPYVQTGCIWSTVSGLNGTMTSGVLYVNGIRVTAASVASNTFTASKDTYVDIDVNGNITYQAVTNNAASPALTANSVRVAIVVSGAASISSYNQGNPNATAPVISSVNLTTTDSLGNLIYPNDPNRRILGYRQSTATFQTSSVTSVQVTGLSMPVIIPTNRRIELIYYSGNSYVAVAQARMHQTIYDGAVPGGTLLQDAGSATPASNPQTSIAHWIGQPNATSKTYNGGLRTENAADAATLEGGTTEIYFIAARLV